MKNNGITLISLIITIIVILILAGVGITISLSVINNTRQAAFMSKMATIEEQVNLVLLEEEIAKEQGQTVNSKITGDSLKLLVSDFNNFSEITKTFILENRGETYNSEKTYTDEDISSLFKLGEDITKDSSYASLYDAQVGAVYKIEPVIIGGKANVGTGKVGIIATKNKIANVTENKASNEMINISVGNNNYFVIDKEGNLWGCGSNTSAQLGNGTTINAAIPILIQKRNKISKSCCW